MRRTSRLSQSFGFVAALLATLALLTTSADAWKTPETQTVLYAFHGPDGSAPYQIVEGVDGTLYGATSHGGAYGSGTVFALKPPAHGTGPWTLTVLASVPAGLPGQLSVNPSGTFALFGSLPHGGLGGPWYEGDCDPYGGPYGCGSIFEVTPPPGGHGAWTTTTLYEFTGGGDGGEPGGIVLSGGTVFGTVASGGYAFCHLRSGCGGAFILAPPPAGKTTWTESMPIGFFPDNTGSPPSSTMLGPGPGGAYGMVWSYTGGESLFGLDVGAGGTFDSEGFPSGLLADESGALYVWTSTSMLYQLVPPSFTKHAIFRLPVSGVNLMLAHLGSVYGAYSPAVNVDEIVSLTPPARGQGAWSPHLLFTFTGGSAGAHPNSMIFGKSGDLYGTTSGGGIADSGVIYRLSTPRHVR